MEAEDVINLVDSDASAFADQSHEIVSLVNKDDESKSGSENMEISESDIGNDDSRMKNEIITSKDFAGDSSAQENVELTETVEAAKTIIEGELTNSLNAADHVQNGRINVQNASPICNSTADVSSASGVKRARLTSDEQQPFVHVTYNSLTRASIQKLEELLQRWSEWHAQHGSSANDPKEETESGEETYFPALRVGVEKVSAVSFWIDNHTKNQQNKGLIPLDNTATLYDRGYASGLTLGDASTNLEGGLEILGDPSRCFNCGSYSHSLKECPRPRDNVAVTNAQKQRKSKRNQNSSSRNPARYYLDPVKGKYDGLRPGALDAETRKLLGLGELDPPPWLNRMRELGYPPGYLDESDEDQPSGITIFADGEMQEEQQEDGEIIETDPAEPRKKMTVEFPGINAPIPENADERRWAPGSSSSKRSRDSSRRRSNNHSDSSSRGHHREQRWSMDSRDDGPPGCDSNSPFSSSYPPRYGALDSNFDSPTFGRSQSERSRRSPLIYEDYMGHSSHNSPHSYLDRLRSPPDYDLGRFGNEFDRNRDDRNMDHSSRGRDELYSWHTRHIRRR